MKRHIVCLGDSNTHGYCADPADCADGSLRRFNESERWTCRLQAALGEDFLVLEEGLPGRTTVFDDPVEESLSALPYLYPCLMSHAPVSLLVVMLGTNDTKERLGANACAIGKGLLVLTGFGEEDGPDFHLSPVFGGMARKLLDLRIFPGEGDRSDKFDRSARDHGADVLLVPQFTLYADCRKGKRPSYSHAARPEEAKALYAYFNQKLTDKGIPVGEGIFQAEMLVRIYNDGPVTILLDSHKLF